MSYYIVIKNMGLETNYSNALGDTGTKLYICAFNKKNIFNSDKKIDP